MARTANTRTPRNTAPTTKVTEPDIQQNDDGITKADEDAARQADTPSKGGVTHRLKDPSEWENQDYWTLTNYLSLVPIDWRGVEIASLKIGHHADSDETRIDWTDLYGNKNFVYTFKTPPEAILVPARPDADTDTDTDTDTGTADTREDANV